MASTNADATSPPTSGTHPTVASRISSDERPRGRTLVVKSGGCSNSVVIGVQDASHVLRRGVHHKMIACAIAHSANVCGTSGPYWILCLCAITFWVSRVCRIVGQVWVWGVGKRSVTREGCIARRSVQVFALLSTLRGAREAHVACVMARICQRCAHLTTTCCLWRTWAQGRTGACTASRRNFSCVFEWEIGPTVIGEDLRLYAPC